MVRFIGDLIDIVIAIDGYMEKRCFCTKQHNTTQHNTVV